MGFKKVVCLGLALVLFSNFVLGEIMINEVMYDPGQCSDADCEWVELYNPSNETIDLSGCSFDGDMLSGNISGESYLLLVRNEEEFKNNFAWEGNLLEISLNLINSGKELKLMGGNCSGSEPFNYTNYVNLADGNNKTLEKNKKGEWKESLVSRGTPGRKNSVYDFSYDFSVLEITEVMADPFGDDEALKPLGEWVEIYNSGTEPVYLEGLVLYDSEDDDELYVTDTNTNSLELCGGCYGVIYRNGDGDFDLSKVKDKVRLYTDYPVFAGVLIDELSFANAMEGMSFSKFDAGWYLAEPTPGTENLYTEGCDWEVEVAMENAIFQGDDLEFDVSVLRNYGFDDEVTVKGEIEDIFGEVVKEYKPWTDVEVETSRTKSYSPNLGEGVYQISFWIEELDCADQKLENNRVEKLVAINPQYKVDDSTLEIERLYLGSDDSAEWGDQFTVKVNVYKGNSSRYSVQIWAEKDGEKVSKTTKLSIFDEYKDYPLTIPIQLEPNCHNKIADGKATLVVSAFGLSVEEEFEISGIDDEVCKDYLEYVKDLNKDIVAQERKAKAYQVVDLPTKISRGELMRVKVQLLGDDRNHDYKAWSYLYRGNKCYSCGDKERDENLIEFNLRPGEVKQAEMLVKVDDEIDEGEYNLKVKLNKDEQKTDKELTEVLYVEEEVNESVSLLSGGDGAEEKLLTKTSERKKEVVRDQEGIVIYESSSEKAKNLIPYLLIAVLVLVSLILIWKKA